MLDLIKTIKKDCRKQSLKYLWENYEFYNNEEYKYYKEYYKKHLGIKVVD